MTRVVRFVALIGSVLSLSITVHPTQKHTAHPNQARIPAWWQHTSGAIVWRMCEKVKCIVKQRMTNFEFADKQKASGS
jgi:hypothetical protein